MARGTITKDRIYNLGRMRTVMVTRMDGKPVDRDEWITELKIPPHEVSRVETAFWADADVPGMMHGVFTWWPGGFVAG